MLADAIVGAENVSLKVLDISANKLGDGKEKISAAIVGTKIETLTVDLGVDLGRTRISLGMGKLPCG